jgi:four helix bundle protein
MKVTRFEDLEVWQQARDLTRQVYRLTANGSFSRDYGLKDQMRRASVSTMANIAEGFSRRGDKEFCQFLFVAKSSAAELQSHAYVAVDQGYITETDFKGLYESLDHVSRMLSNLIKRLLHGPRDRRVTRSTQ